MLNPDKYIRKGFVSALKDLEVENPYSGEDTEIKTHDYRVPLPDTESQYILINQQSSEPNEDNKCRIIGWDCHVTLDIVTIFKNRQGSRLFADDIKEKVMNLTENLSIDNFSNDEQIMTFPDDLTEVNNTQSIFRKLINYDFVLTEKTNNNE